MSKLFLIRDLNGSEGNKVKGKLLITKGGVFDFDTIENLLYLCPEGCYLVKYEYSPKFDKYLWELYGVNKRTEIKFHLGDKPEQSKGCILLGGDSLNMLHNMLDSGTNYIINIKNL